MTFRPHPKSLDGISAHHEDVLKEFGFIDVNNAIVGAMITIANQATPSQSSSMSFATVSEMIKVNAEQTKMEIRKYLEVMGTEVIVDAYTYTDIIVDDLNLTSDAKFKAILDSVENTINLFLEGTPSHRALPRKLICFQYSMITKVVTLLLKYYAIDFNFYAHVVPILFMISYSINERNLYGYTLVLYNVLFSLPKPFTTLKHGLKLSSLFLPSNASLLSITPSPLSFSMLLYKTMPHNKPTSCMPLQITFQYDMTTKLTMLPLNHNQTTNTISTTQIKNTRWTPLYTINKFFLYISIFTNKTQQNNSLKNKQKNNITT